MTILTTRTLATRADHARQRCQRVVLANGCFDLLHLGHVATLQAARALGDLLLVLVDSDESVRRLKGAGRPVVPELERAALVAALRCVDGVAVFDGEDLPGLIRAIRPAVLAKGGTTGAIVGEDLLGEWGGRACRLPAVPDLSTSARLAAIRR